MSVFCPFESLYRVGHCYPCPQKEQMERRSAEPVIKIDVKAVKLLSLAPFSLCNPTEK